MRTTRDTKSMFADKLEDMMRQMPLSKVRVVDLCTRCGVERRVFYYHFRDKYDLVAWMFERDHALAVDGNAPYSEELYAEAHRRLWARRDFYRRAFAEDSQNSIWRYLLQFSIAANEAALKRYLGVRVLSRRHAFEARHFAHGNVGCVVEWLEGEIEATSEQLAAEMFACMPNTLHDAYAAQHTLNKPPSLVHWRLRLSRSLDDLPEHPLPTGYHFVRYVPGDRDTWIAIEQSAREFDGYEDGVAAWERYFGSHEAELPGRMIFIEDGSGARVATATAFYDTFGRDSSGSAWLHWVSVRRDRQGCGLSKPLVCEAFRIMRGLGYDRVIVPTQTNTWLAVRVYLDLGCRPTLESAEESETGWRIVRTLTGHPALASFEPVGLDVILGA